MVQYIQDTVQLENEINWIQSQHTLALDTETTGLDPLSSKVILLQIGTPDRQLVIDTRKIKKEHIRQLLDLLNAIRTEKILHNAKFDYKMLKCNFGVELNNMKCTMIAGQLLSQGRPDLRCNLAELADKYLGLKIDKEEQTSFVKHKGHFTQSQIEYAAMDVQYLIPLYNKIRKILLERGMIDLADLEYATIKVTGDMEINGVYIDTNKWRSLEHSARRDAFKLQLILDPNFTPTYGCDLFGNANLSYDSPQQMKVALEKVTGLKLESTDAKKLEVYDHPVIEAFLKYKKAQKLITTYGQGFLDKYLSKIDARLHSDFHQLGTDSGRYSSKNPNMQNIPHQQEYRDPFCVEDDSKRIIAADFSGQELRLMAHISQDDAFIKGIEQGLDLHCYSASLLFDIAYEKFFDDNGKRLKDMDAKYRNPAKSITFGLIYGMGPLKLSTQLGIEFDAAKELMNRYFKVFPKIKKCLDNLTAQAKLNHYALSPLDGRRRDLTTFDWDNGKRASHAINIAKNLPFQGAGASVTKLAMCKIDHEISSRGLGAKIILSVHDEILCECLESESIEMASIMQTKMIEAFNHYAPSVKMEVEPKIGLQWIH